MCTKRLAYLILVLGTRFLAAAAARVTFLLKVSACIRHTEQVSANVFSTTMCNSTIHDAKHQFMERSENSWRSQFTLKAKNCDILMHGKKEKTTGCEAYLTYVSDLWFASAAVRRKIAQFFNV